MNVLVTHQSKVHLTSHTPSDLERFARDGVNPDSRQPRENAVMCQTCGARGVWNVNGVCDRHDA